VSIFSRFTQFNALGELALDGSIRPVSGLLAMLIAAKNAGFLNVIVPAANAAEAALIANSTSTPCRRSPTPWR
jgi:magnesium chelatase family protein